MCKGQNCFIINIRLKHFSSYCHNKFEQKNIQLFLVLNIDIKSIISSEKFIKKYRKLKRLRDILL